MNSFINIFKEKGDMLENKALKSFTTWKVGGPARVIFFPFEEATLAEAINYLHQNEIDFRIIGRGSNLLVSDAPFNGVVIILTKLSNKITQKSENRFEVSAGVGMQQLSRYLANNHYKGHEFFSGIPGSVGGGVVMNAGTAKGEFKDVVVQAKVVTSDGTITWLSNDELSFAYRESMLKSNRSYVVVAVDMYFEKEMPNEKGQSLHTVKSDKLVRREKQPLNSPNCGSVFKNPQNGFAGQYIEELGLKGYRVGGAEVSLKHANFIINTGNASADDIITIIRYIQDQVKATFDIELETEVELLNFEK